MNFLSTQFLFNYFEGGALRDSSSHHGQSAPEKKIRELSLRNQSMHKFVEDGIRATLAGKTENNYPRRFMEIEGEEYYSTL